LKKETEEAEAKKEKDKAEKKAKEEKLKKEKDEVIFSLEALVSKLMR